MAALMSNCRDDDGPRIRGATFFSDTYRVKSLITALGLDWYEDILPRWSTHEVGAGQNPVIPPEMARRWFDELWARTNQEAGSLRRLLNWPSQALAHSSEDCLNDRLVDLLSFLWVSYELKRNILVTL